MNEPTDWNQVDIETLKAAFANTCCMVDIRSAMWVFRSVTEEKKRIIVNNDVTANRRNTSFLSSGLRNIVRTPLFFFVEYASLSSLEEIFPYVEDLNKSCDDLDKNTPLTLAVRCDRSDVVKFLLDNGADINAGRESPTYIAVVNNNCNLFDLLLRYDPDIDLKGLPPPNPNSVPCSVYRRAMNPNYGGHLILRSLVNHLISTERMDSVVATDCFSRVVQNNDLILIHTLLKYGIDMDVIDTRGCMPEIRSDEMTAILACEGYILTPVRMLRSINPCIRRDVMGTIKIFVALGLEIRNFVDFSPVVYQDKTRKAYELILSCSPSTFEGSERISTLLRGLRMIRSDAGNVASFRALLLTYDPSFIDPQDFDLVPSLRKKAIQCLRSMKLREEIEELRIRIETSLITKDWQSLLK